TVLFVSHNMGAVSALCEHGLLLSGGRLLLDGNVGMVIERYARANTEEYNAVFTANSSHPSITRVTIDRDGLKRRDLRIEIIFESTWPLQMPIGGIVLRAASGQPVWGSNGRFHPRSRDTSGIARGHLICEARNIPLVSGHYLVSVWLADRNIDYDARID